MPQYERQSHNDHGPGGLCDQPSPDEYDSYPDFVTGREIHVRVETKGFRNREIVLFGSLLDDNEYSKENPSVIPAELNLRSLKTVMQMDHLRRKQPHCVRNELRAELRAHLTATS